MDATMYEMQIIPDKQTLLGLSQTAPKGLSEHEVKDSLV